MKYRFVLTSRGFGSEFISLCEFVAWCWAQGHSPRLDDSRFVWGRYGDHFLDPHGLTAADDAEELFLGGRFCEEYHTMDWASPGLNHAVKELWKIRPEKLAAIAELAQGDYVALHVRRGDKVGDESGDYPLEDYVEPILSRPDGCRRCFVATDDYGAFERLRQRYPALEFFTYCDKAWRGSDPAMYRKEDAFAIIRDIQIASKAAFYVCTKTSNFSKICLNLRDMQRYHSLDDW